MQSMYSSKENSSLIFPQKPHLSLSVLSQLNARNDLYPVSTPPLIGEFANIAVINGVNLFASLNLRIASSSELKSIQHWIPAVSLIITSDRIPHRYLAIILYLFFGIKFIALCVVYGETP